MNKLISIVAVLLICKQSIVFAVEYDNVGEYLQCLEECGGLWLFRCTADTDCHQFQWLQTIEQQRNSDCINFASWLNEQDDSIEFAKHNITLRQDCLDATATNDNNTALMSWNTCDKACIDNTAALVCTRTATTVGEYDTCARKCDYANEYNCNMNYQCMNGQIAQKKCESSNSDCEAFETFTEKDWATSFTNVTIDKQQSCLTACVDTDTTVTNLIDWDECIQSCTDALCECCDADVPEEEAEEEENEEEEEFEQDIDTIGKFRDAIADCDTTYRANCLNEPDCFKQQAKQFLCLQLQSGCTAFTKYDGDSSDGSSITNVAKANEVECLETCSPVHAPILDSIKYLSDWNTCNLKCIYKVSSTDKQENNKKDDGDGDGGDDGSASILSLGVMTLLALFTTLSI